VRENCTPGSAFDRGSSRVDVKEIRGAGGGTPKDRRPLCSKPHRQLGKEPQEVATAALEVLAKRFELP
jgi:hypothetical protein